MEFDILSQVEGALMGIGRFLVIKNNSDSQAILICAALNSLSYVLKGLWYLVIKLFLTQLCIAYGT